MAFDIEAAQRKITELQEQVAAEQAREAELGPENTAVVKYHDISCHESYCHWSFENDSAFDKPNSGHSRVKSEYLEMKGKAENVLGAPLEHETFLKLLLATSGVYYQPRG